MDVHSVLRAEYGLYLWLEFKLRKVQRRGSATEVTFHTFYTINRWRRDFSRV